MSNQWEYDESEYLWYHKKCDAYASEKTGLCPLCHSRYPGFWKYFRKRYKTFKNYIIEEFDLSDEQIEILFNR